MALKAAELVYEISGDTRSLDQTLSGLDAKLSKSFAGVERSVTGIAGALQSAFGGALLGLGKDIVEIGFSFNSLKQQALIAFETMLGGAQQAKAFFEDLVNFAAATPFELPGLIQSAQKLKAFGFEAQQILPMLKAIGDAASALSIGQPGIDRIVLALGQMRQATRVTGNELRQLQEAGVPALEILAKHFGKTEAEIRKMVEKGLVPANASIAALIQGMEQRFPDMMKKQSQSFEGLISTIKDFGRVVLGQITGPLFESVSGALGGLVEKLQAFSAAIKEVGLTKAISEITGLSEPLIKAGIAFAAVLAVVGPLAGVIAGLVSVVALVPAPVLAVVAALALLAGAFAANIGGIRDKAMALFRELAALYKQHEGDIKQLLAVVQSIFGLILKAISVTIGNIIDIIRAGVAILSGDWQKGFELLAGVLRDRLNFIIQDVIPGFWNAFKTLFTMGLSAVHGIALAALDALISLFKNLPGMIVGALGGLSDQVGGVFGTLLVKVPFIFGEFMGVITRMSAEFVNAVLDRFAGLVAPIVEYFLTIVQKVREWVSTMISTGGQGIAGFVKTIGGILINLPQIATQVLIAVVNAVLSFVKKIFDAAKSVGSALMSGFRSGFASGAGGGGGGGGEAGGGGGENFLDKFMKDINEKIANFGKGLGGAGSKLGAGAGKAARDATKKVLQESAQEIEAFLKAAGATVQVTEKQLAELVKKAPDLAKSIREGGKAFAELKNAIEQINFERVAKGIAPLGDQVKIVGKTIELEFNTLKALPQTVIDAFQKLGFTFKAIFPGMERVVVDWKDATKESAEVAEAAIKQFGEQVQKAALEIETAAPTVSNAMKKINDDIQFHMEHSAVVMKASIAGAVNNVISDFERMGQELNLKGADLERFVEQNVRKTLERIPGISQETIDKMLEIWKKGLNRLPGIWDEVFDRFSAKTKGVIGGILDVIGTMPGKIGDTLNKVKSQIEKWVNFIDSALKLLHKLFNQVPDGIGKAMDAVIGIFKKSASSVQKEVDGIGTAVNAAGSKTAAGMGTIAEKTQKASDGFKTAMGAMSGALAGFMTGVSLAVSGASTAASAIGGALTGALSGFMAGGGPVGAVIGGIGGLLGGLFGKSGHQKKMEKLAEQKAELELEGLKEGIKKAMQETVQAVLQTMKDALALFEELPAFAAIPTKHIQAFMKNLEQLLTMFVEVAGRWSSDLLKKAKEFAESIGPAIEMIAGGVEAFEKLGGFIGVSQLSIDDFGKALEGVITVLGGILDSVEKRTLKLARRLAEKLFEIIDVISGGVEAFTGLMEFKEIPQAAIDAFGTALMAAITAFMGISENIDRFLLKQASASAEKMMAVVALMGEGVEALKGLLDFQAVPMEVITEFAVNMQHAIEKFVEVTTAMDAGLIQRAASIAERLLSILNVIKALPEAFAPFRDYKMLSDTLGIAVMRDFDMMAELIENLMKRAVQLKGNVEAFASVMRELKALLQEIFGEGLFGGAGAGAGGLPASAVRNPFSFPDLDVWRNPDAMAAALSGGGSSQVINHNETFHATIDARSVDDFNKVVETFEKMRMMLRKAKGQ